MQDFCYQTPTKLIFGKGVVEQLPAVMAKLGRRILLAYGGGSIKKIGLYDKVKELLSDFEVYELSGIMPNPKYDPSVLDGVRICREKDIDAILAVGGGSVLDCSKAIAVGAKYDGDVWDLITGRAVAQDATPIVDIITLAATGSEYDAGCVISRTETDDKIGYGDPHLFPVASFLDPTYTFSVSKRQTAAGCADAMSHIMEQYFCEDSTLMGDGMMEAGLKSLMINAKKCLDDPEDYTVRAEIMLACSYACNGILSLGCTPSGWPCHGIEHALSAYYDITHGEGLAIITPHWMRRILSEKTVGRFVKFGVNVFGISPDQDSFAIADQAIGALSRFFGSIGLPTRLRDVGIDDSRIDEMARHIAVNEGLEEAWAPLLEQDLADILTESL